MRGERERKTDTRDAMLAATAKGVEALLELAWRQATPTHPSRLLARVAELARLSGGLKAAREIFEGEMER